MNKANNRIPDCKIYFPPKGLVGKVESQYQSKPKFIIVPKDKYIKMHPEYKKSSSKSPNRSISAKRSLRASVLDRSTQRSLVEQSSPIRVPK